MKLDKKQKYTDEQLKEEFMTIYLLHLSVFEFTFVKKINILQGIKSFMDSKENLNAAEEDKVAYDKVSWAIGQNYETTQKTL